MTDFTSPNAVYGTAECREDVIDAVRILKRTERGRNVMKHFVAWFQEGGLGLDPVNKEAVLTLLDGAFGSYPGTALDAMRQALEEGEEE